MPSKKKSFLQRITGSSDFDDEELFEDKPTIQGLNRDSLVDKWEQDAELSVDVHQTASSVIVQTMISGVSPDNLSITITRDMITIKGKREESRSVSEDNYFIKELYWGGFSRTIALPEEVDPEEAEATEKHGLLTIKLPKINKNKETTLKVKSV